MSRVSVDPGGPGGFFRIAGNRRSTAVAGCCLGLLAVLVVGLFVGRGSAAFTADDAIACLMARDITHLRDAPVFFSGQEYLGALDSYWLAVLFVALPEGVATFRVALGALFVFTVLVVWRLTSLAFGQRAGLVAGLYLAVGPPFLLYKSLSAGYGAVLLAVALLVFLLVRLEARIQAGQGTHATLALLGLVGGLAWWLHPLCGVVGFSALTAGAAGGVRRHMLRVSRVGILVLTFIVGSLPWWVRNLHTGFASLGGPHTSSVALQEAVARLPSLATQSLPIFYGGGSVVTEGQHFEGVWILTTGFFLLAAVCSVWLARRAGTQLGRFAAAACAPIFLVMPALVVVNAITDFGEPRYLFPLYVATAVVVGAASTHLVRSRWLQTIVVMAIIGFHVIGHTRWVRFDGASDTSPTWAQNASDAILANGVSRLFASYWIAYPMTFASGGRVISTPFGAVNMTRRAGDRATVAASANPAFLLDREESERFEILLHASGADYDRATVGGKILLKNLTSFDLTQAKRCLCVPAGWGPGSVEWLGVSVPSRVSPGVAFIADVKWRHHLALPWPQNARLSYHWRSLDRRDVDFENARTPVPGSPRAGQDISVSVQVVAPSVPGDYVLVFDVVEEGVTWLEAAGNRPLEHSLLVRE